MTTIIKQSAARLGLALAALAAAAPLILIAPHAELVKRAAGISSSASGVSGIVSAANDLTMPLMVAIAAIAPLACLAGLGLLLVGNRKGMGVIGTSIGVLIGLGAVSGIIA